MTLWANHSFKITDSGMNITKVLLWLWNYFGLQWVR